MGTGEKWRPCFRRINWNSYVWSIAIINVIGFGGKRRILWIKNILTGEASYAESQLLSKVLSL